MSLAALLALLLGLALTAYALLAGADFGAGILDLIAGRNAEDRAAIEATIGPVWEANHVWLIFAVTIMFSAFPAAFSALGTALLAPLTVALLAIVVRGAAFGVRSGQALRTKPHLLLSRLFGAASALAPFAFGLVAGGLAQAANGRSPSVGHPPVPWRSPFAVSVGLLAVCLCVQLAASLMTRRLAGAGRVVEAERFRRRGIQAGAGTVLVGVGGLLLARAGTAHLFARLTGAALPVVLVAVACLAVSSLAMIGRRYAAAQAFGLLGGAAIVWGWFVSQSPHLIGTRLTIHTAAATPPAITAVAIACGAVLVGVIPATFLLYSMFPAPVRR